MSTEPAKDPEQHNFATEVQQLLNLMIHSLYSKREVFLRELLSNASDALDTARFLALTNPELRASGEDPAIVLIVDKDARTISIADNGIGMTREQVISNIGTIARSGSGLLLKKMREEGKDKGGDKGSPLDLIGQFGVGFYSAFMVSDRVDLVTLSAEPGAEAVAWHSEGGGTYTLSPGHRSHAGTTVTLHLKEDAGEFLEDWRVEQIVKEYSNYVKWPIRHKGKALNQSIALWAKRPADVTEDEYQNFYQELMGGFVDDKPLSRMHLSMDAPYQFQAIVYVPGHAPYDFLGDQNKRRGMQLYVRRVFILDHAEELLPPYLRFLRGVVDSDDLPLNVSREILQKNQVIETIQKQIVKKGLEELKRLKEGKPEEYRTFWDEFGSILKEGVYLDAHNRDKIAELLLLSSLKTPADKRIALAEYVQTMPEGQEDLYYITGPSREAVEESPHLESLRKLGVDVLLLIDPIDEWVVQGLTEFSGKKLRSITKGEFEPPQIKGAKGAEPGKDEEKKTPEQEEMMGALIAHLRVRFQEAVKEVRLSNRLTESPSVLVAGAGDMGRNLEQLLMRANRKVPEAKPILEINPDNGFVRDLARLLKENPLSEPMEAYSDLLLELAYLSQGTVRKPAQLVSSMSRLLQRDIYRGASRDATEKGDPAKI